MEPGGAWVPEPGGQCFTEPGGQELEAERHQTFRALRVPGQREWFYAGRDLQDHIREVLAQHGPPPADLPTLQAGDGMLNT